MKKNIRFLIAMGVPLAMGLVSCQNGNEEKTEEKTAYIYVKVVYGDLKTMTYAYEKDAEIDLSRFSSYRDSSFVCQGWNDGTNNYAPDSKIKATSDLTLTGTFSKRTASFALSNDGTYYVFESLLDDALTEYAVPTTYNEKPVKEIGEKAFSRASNLTKLTIPTEIEKISAGFLTGSRKIEELTLPYIGGNQNDSRECFWYCYGRLDKNDGIYVSSLQKNFIPAILKKVHLTNDKRIADNSFIGIQSISDLTLDNVVYLGNDALSDMPSLKTLETTFKNNAVIGDGFLKNDSSIETWKLHFEAGTTNFPELPSSFVLPNDSFKVAVDSESISNALKAKWSVLSSKIVVA